MINKNTYESYQDIGFWMDKAKHDFDETFNDVKTVKEARERYNQLFLEYINIKLLFLPFLATTELNARHISDMLGGNLIQYDFFNFNDDEIKEIEKYYDIEKKNRIKY